MLEEVERWLSSRSWSAADRPLGRLLEAKRQTGRTVSVVLPALDEEATVGAIVAAIRGELMTEAAPLVDELVVLDSGSTDRTAEVAAAAGARVVHRDSVLPRLPALPGKGEVLWRSLLATSGDIVCFVDADLREFSPSFVSGIVGPLLTDPDIQFVKAMYDRPLETGVDGSGAGQGGRVTELVARPLLNLHWPQLAGFVQPLGGEYAARRVAAGAAAVPGRLRRRAGPARRRAAHRRPGRPGAGRRGRAQAPPPGRPGAREDGRGDLPHRPTAPHPRPLDPASADPVRPRAGRIRAAHDGRGHRGAAPDGRYPGIRRAAGGLTDSVRLSGSVAG